MLAIGAALVACVWLCLVSPYAATAGAAVPRVAPRGPAPDAAPLAPLAQRPSRTQPYAACPRPKRRHAACQSIVVPVGAKLLTPSASALPATGGVNGSGLTPAELQSAYALPSATAGEGQTVALVDAYDDPTAESDLATYRSAYGLPPCRGESGCFRKVNQEGGTAFPPLATAGSGDWELEESLDLDMVSAICPNCHILLVEAESNTFQNLDAAEREAASLGATEISNSWAAPEFAGETSLDQAFDHPGIPITAGSGDDGYDNYDLPASAPSYPATSPYVIAVGGTVLAPAATARGWSERVWSRSGSGCSLYEPKPTYQTDNGCPRRTSNDVAAVAEDLSVYDTTHATGDSGSGWITVGGTSAATPIVASVEALSEEPERELGPEAFYKSPGSLFDIVSGNNGSCGAGYLCEAGGGYDGPTGNGTPDGALSLSEPSPPPQLSVRREGTGAGSVTSSPAGIECGNTCARSLPPGSQVTLTAAPAAGSTFAGWQGPCTGTGACTLTLTKGASVGAIFRSPGAPTGWGQQTLFAPAEREPFLAGSSLSESFYNVSLSASGEVRAKTVYNPPTGSCTFASSNTGGVYLERRRGSSWITEGAITGPAIGGGVRWANCDGFGEVTQLSGDGSTLLVTQSHINDHCAAFVYDHGPSGWTLQGTLLPPGVEASGEGTPAICDYFGSEGAISDDGGHVAVSSDGRVSVFAREGSTWSLEQNIVLPNGPGCTETIGHRNLALSGDGTTMLVGQSACQKEGTFEVGRAYFYTRSPSGWSLTQTTEAPEPATTREFGQGVALADDGSTAVIAGRAGGRGTVWVYERGAHEWRMSARVADPQAQAVLFDCPVLAAGGARMLCNSLETVGFNGNQGAIYAFERPVGGWSSGVPSPQRAFAADGLSGDDLGRYDEQGWWLLAATADGSLIDAPISPVNIAGGLYPDDLIGYEFTAPGAYSTPSISGIQPASGGAGTQVTIAGTNLNGASSVSFSGTEAVNYEARSPTQILATVPPGAKSGAISVRTPGGSGTSAESFTFLKPETPPVVSSITPTRGPTAGGTAITIKGANFLAGVSVALGAPASHVEVRSESEIVATAPAEPAGSYEVTVADEAGTSTGGPKYTYVPPAPTVESVSPTKGPTAGGTIVTIRGANFQASAGVTVGAAASHVDVRSESEIVATTPAQPAGSYEVTVTDEGGASTGGPRYTYVPAPTVESVFPAKGPIAGGTTLVIEGANFQAGAAVTVGAPASHVYVVSESEILATTPAQSAGSYEVNVSDEGGSSTGGPRYSYVPPAPSVESVSPAKGPITGGMTVTIKGAHFQAAASVTIGAAASHVEVRSESELVATTPAQSAGSYEVIVSDEGGSSTGGPRYTYVPPAPSVESVSPAKGPTTGGMIVTITGANFQAAASVTIGAAASHVEVRSESELVATTPAEPAGSYEVTVTDEGGTSTGGPRYTYVPPAPTVESVSPAKGPTTGGTTVTIKGASFQASAGVTIGAAASHVEVRSESELVATTPAEPAGSYEVTVADEGGTSTGGPKYTYAPPVPTIESVSPIKGPTAGGTTVTIKGANFEVGSSVTIGGSASHVEVRSAGEIVVTTPAESAGSYKVIVTDEAGTSTNGPGYTYVPPVLVSAITPASGPSDRHGVVTITGDHFLKGATVTIGGRASTVKVHSETEITARTPKHAPGSYEVVVSDELGESSGGPAYTYLAPYAPEVESITPAEGPIGGGTTVTIEGSGFVKGAKVRIGPKGRDSAVVLSTSEMVVVTQPEPPGSFEVVVTDKYGTSVNGPEFSFMTSPDGAQTPAHGLFSEPLASEALVTARSRGRPGSVQE